jgi:hypothetical protein
MLALVSVFWDIVLLRRGPREVPASGALLIALAVLYFAASIATARLGFGPALAVVRALIDIGTLLGAFSALLALRGCVHRVLQTLTALLGSGLVLYTAAILLLAALHAAAAAPGFAPLLKLAVLLVDLWGVVVVGHIVRDALDVPLLTGLAVSLSYAVLTIVLLLQLPKPPVT